jgi:hypothetical protein
MDTMQQLSISPMLKEAAELKIDELNQAKEAFKRRYRSDSAKSADNETITRVKALLDDITKLNPELEDDDDLCVIAHYIKLASDDRSVSRLKLLKFEEQIRTKLEKHFNRLEVSSIHVELLKEVLGVGEYTTSVASQLDTVDLDGDFEVVETELDEVLEKFEKETFTAAEVDVEAIEAYLSSIMVDSRGIEVIRGDLATFSDEIVEDGLEIDQDFLMWCIADLLKSTLIGEDKKRTLEGYLQSPIALRELASILKTKSVRHWEYKNADKGLPVTVLQNSEGQFCIAVEESVIDMLFLYCIGTGWAMKLKSCLSHVARYCTSFSNACLTTAELNKRRYFLDPKPVKPPVVEPAPTCSVCHSSFPPPAPMPPPPPRCMSMPPPPPSMPYPPGIMAPYWGPPPPPPPPGYGSMDSTRCREYTQEFFMSRLPDESGCTPEIKPPEDVQARLMKTLAVERKLREAFDGQVHVGSVQFKSLASSLPHQTILTVLKFLGVPTIFLTLFERFLSTNLNIGPAVRGAPDRVLPRARGVPEGHTLEVFFTEAVLFFLELVVHQKTGSYLYRLRDKGYFVGNREQHQAYQEHVAIFASMLGLDFTFEDGQSIGFLSIDTHNTNICSGEVVTYARSVKQQLNTCITMLDWVRVWNNTVGTYQTHLFGPLANVFGEAHLQNVREAYKVIFDIILDGVDLTDYISQLLTVHLRLGLRKPSFPLEALIYLPQAYGGLGVKNPFITLNLAHKLYSSPNDAIKTYLDNEDKYYENSAETYASLDAEARALKIETIFNNDTAQVDAALGPNRDLTIFMSKEELTAHRERTNYPQFHVSIVNVPYDSTSVLSLTSLYADLLCEPSDDTPGSERIRDEVRRLSGKDDMKSWNRLSGEDKWVVQLYGDECFDTYGGLEIWCGESVPQEVLKIVRGGTWDADDDSSSVSDMTEV